ACVYAPAACPAHVVVLPGHSAALQMAHTGVVRVCGCCLPRASRLARSSAGDGRAAYRMVERVSGDVGGHSRHDDLAVSVFLASLARSRARAGTGAATRRHRCEVAGGADGCPHVRDHRGKSEESFLVEPGEIGLAPLEEAAHSIDQDAKGRLAQLAAGLAE